MLGRMPSGRRRTDSDRRTATLSAAFDVGVAERQRHHKTAVNMPKLLHASGSPGVSRLPGPVGEDAAGGQRVRVAGSQDPLAHRQQRGELIALSLIHI